MKHELLNDWLRSGQPAMSDALRKHLNVCPLCASELKEIQTYQTLLAGPDPVLTEDRSAEIRFLLEAESNRKRSTREMESHPRPWFLRIPWVPVAAAAVLAGVLFGGVMLFQHAGSGDGSEKADSLARITPAPGARWSREYLSNTEIVMLEEGTIGLHVRRLAPGQSFLVKTGADWVEVRGTAFSVTASEGRLKSVDVAEGVVSVHVAAGSLLLLAGQQWSRTADRTPADRTPAEQTPADRTPAEQPPRPMNLASNPPTPPVPTEDPRIPSGLAAGNPLPPPARPPVDSMTAPTDPRTPAPEAMTAPVPPAAPAEPPAESPLLIRFSGAYRTLQAGNWRKSVTLFSDLLQEHGLGAKRADVLFWLAQAHLKGGQHPQAIARLQEFLRSYPNAWHAKDAREQLRLLQTEK